jgi:hypothetical protein
MGACSRVKMNNKKILIVEDAPDVLKGLLFVYRQVWLWRSSSNLILLFSTSPPPTVLRILQAVKDGLGVCAQNWLMPKGLRIGYIMPDFDICGIASDDPRRRAICISHLMSSRPLCELAIFNNGTQLTSR